MKRILLGLLLALGVAQPARAQLDVVGRSLGAVQTVTTLDSGTACSTAHTCATFLSAITLANGVTLQVTGTYTGTLTLEATIDGSNWESIQAIHSTDGSLASTIVSTAGLYSFTNRGYAGVRTRATAWTSGTATVSGFSGAGSSAAGATIAGTLPSFGTVQSFDLNDGSGNAITSTASALDVNIKTSAVSSAVDTDDASIAAGQASVALTADLGMYYDGTVWRRRMGCPNSIIYDASTSGNTQLVAISSTTHIYICQWTIFAAGTVNVSLVTGTGSACGSAASGTPSTGTSGASAALTPAYQLTTQTGIVRSAQSSGWLYDTGSANALCLKTSAGIAVQAEVWYLQQ